MVELPYDIWHLVSLFLAEEDARCLYSVCRPLFNIALDLRYRKVCVAVSKSRVPPGFKDALICGYFKSIASYELYITY